jgi:hypothetical protein
VAQPTRGKAVADKETALQAFTRKADDCAALLDQLAEFIADCREAATADPENWGHSGTMDDVRTRLIQATALIGGLEESEVVATLNELSENT